jgi:protein-S-isoprenylcysteine O-methyltransferase Ste14
MPADLCQVVTTRIAGRLWVTGQLILILAVAVTAPLFRGKARWPLVPAIVCFAAGAWAGLSGTRSLGRSLTPMPVPREGARLITSGIYARLRHPLYASVMALGFGWALVWASVPGGLVAVALAVYLRAKALVEERHLRARFPDYDAYARTVPRFIPRLSRG